MFSGFDPDEVIASKTTAWLNLDINEQSIWAQWLFCLFRQEKHPKQTGKELVQFHSFCLLMPVPPPVISD